MSDLVGNIAGHEIIEGDVIKVTIEIDGKVERGFDHRALREEGALVLDDWDLRAFDEWNQHHIGTRVSVEILQKAEPKWHSAQVIKADTLFSRQILVRRHGVHEGLTWQGLDAAGRGHWFDTDELVNVEVIVQ